MSIATIAQTKILFIFCSPPYSCAAGQEGLDALLSATTLEQEVSALFLHDGVFQLKSNQNTSDSDLKQVTKTFQALSDFGVDNIYVYETSMIARSLASEDLTLKAEVLSVAAVTELIRGQFRVFTF